MSSETGKVSSTEAKHCIVCGKEVFIVLDTPKGKVGLCKGHWRHFCGLIAAYAVKYREFTIDRVKDFKTLETDRRVPKRELIEILFNMPPKLDVKKLPKYLSSKELPSNYDKLFK